MRTRVAAAASDLGLDATYTWTAHEGGVALALEVVPDREWDFPLPRLGVRFAVPRALDRVEWFGRGPGEAYPDSRLAARVGRFSARVRRAPDAVPDAAGERLAHRGPLGGPRRPPASRGPPALRAHGPPVDERGARRRPPPDRPGRGRRLALRQRRPGPPGPRLGLLRPRRPAAIPARSGAGDGSA